MRIMSIAKLKKGIAEMIESSDDKEVLEMIFSILDDRSKNADKDILDGLSAEQIKGIEISLAQIERGEYTTHETVIAKVRRQIAHGKKSKVV